MLKKKLGLGLATIAVGAMAVAGGSFALFTSATTNQGNTFSAGTLKIATDKDGQKLFEVNNLAPGDTGSTTITVQNTGTLELRYDLGEKLAGGLTEVDPSGTPGLNVVVKDPSGNTITPGNTNRVLAAGASETLTVDWTLPKEAGNFYQGKGASLDFTFDAEQTKNN